MSLLLDTNVLLWWLWDLPRLGTARAVIGNPSAEVYVSAVSSWEIAIKRSLGQLAVPEALGTWLPQQLEQNRFLPLAVELHHTYWVERLPMHHRDPFDRLLIAQALADRLTLVTGDQRFQAYDAPVILC